MRRSGLDPELAVCSIRISSRSTEIMIPLSTFTLRRSALIDERLRWSSSMPCLSATHKDVPRTAKMQKMINKNNDIFDFLPAYVVMFSTEPIKSFSPLFSKEIKFFREL